MKAKRDFLNLEKKAVDEFCEDIVRDSLVISGEHRYIDIDDFAERYLGLNVLYENLSGNNIEALGFTSDGMNAIEVCRDNVIQIIVFEKNTIVLDKYLLRKGNELLRRMTLAHEVGHILSSKMFGTSLAGFNHDPETQSKMSAEDMMKFLKVSETRADSFAISLLLPPWIVGEAMKKFHSGYRIRKFGKNLVLPEDMISINKMAESLQVTYDDVFKRLDYMGGFVDRPRSEYNRIMGIGGINE